MDRKKDRIGNLPLIGMIWRKIHASPSKQPNTFQGSEKFWIERYNQGRNSGPGSYNQLAIFKATVINRFVEENGIQTVIDYGCGDGNQLRLAKYPSYLGFDVSPHALAQCKELFSQDKSKTFKLVNEYTGETGQLTISLDVIFHLVEDDIFYEYMKRLFNSSTNFVIIYASNFDHYDVDNHPQIKHRQFSNWVNTNMLQWKLIEHIPNKYPYQNDPYNESLSDFYIFQKIKKNAGS
jgi:hypothetical protein